MRDFAAEYATPALMQLPTAPKQAASSPGFDKLVGAGLAKIKSRFGNQGTSAPGTKLAAGDIGGAAKKLSIDDAFNQHMNEMGIAAPPATQLQAPILGAPTTPAAGATLQDLAKLKLAGMTGM